MVNIRALLGIGILVSTALITHRMEAEQTAARPNPASSEQILRLLDHASAQLDALVESIGQNDEEKVRNALKDYTRELSRFHVEFGKLRPRKKDMEFLSSVVDRLDLQVSSLEAVIQKFHPDHQAALSEALNHLRSAVQMAQQKLDPKTRKRLLTIHGTPPGPPIPTKRP